MLLRDQVNADIATAMKAKEATRLSALRMLKAAILNKGIEKGHDLEDAEVQQVIASLIKQRRDSIQQYRAAHRPELAEAEEFELALLSAYLPAQLGEAEVAAEIARAVSESGASGARDMGKVMGILKPALAGRAGRHLRDHMILMLARPVGPAIRRAGGVTPRGAVRCRWGRRASSASASPGRA